jgi:ADP-ribosylglycohydrolase
MINRTTDVRRISRRHGLQSLAAGAACVVVGCFRNTVAAPLRPRPDSDRVSGMLIGGLLGDALGGPVEFSESPLCKQLLCNARNWADDDLLTDETIARLGDSLPLLDYKQLRPETAPYGPWRADAAAGTVTDDSRHKMILMQAIRIANQADRQPSVEDLARAFLAFEPPNSDADPALSALCEEGLREYRYAARWLLGDRDETLARPLERLWAGVNNCSGQMLLPPLAACYPGKPEAAYRAAFDLDFIDSPMARDMAAALVAGLAGVLDPDQDEAPVDARWKLLLQTMRQVDPFHYADVPFAGRQLHRWMQKADELAERAQGSPKQLYRLLETEGDPVYWWDAHFTLLVPLSILRLCRFDPLASLHLTLDFGHDTDSYAQVMGCMIGAVHGETVFPAPMRAAVRQTVREDFDEILGEWPDVLKLSTENQ